MLWKSCRRFTQLDTAAEPDSRIYIRRDKRREEEWERCLLQPASPSQSECNWKAKQWNNERFAVWREMTELFFALFSSCHSSWEQSFIMSRLCRNSLCFMTLSCQTAPITCKPDALNLKSCSIVAYFPPSVGPVMAAVCRRRLTDRHWMRLFISFQFYRSLSMIF